MKVKTSHWCGMYKMKETDLPYELVLSDEILEELGKKYDIMIRNIRGVNYLYLDDKGFAFQKR